MPAVGILENEVSWTVHWKSIAIVAIFGLLAFSGAIRYGAVVGTSEVSESGEPLPGIDHWETWKLNWQSNVLGYLALLLIVAVVLSEMTSVIKRWRPPSNKAKDSDE